MMENKAVTFAESRLEQSISQGLLASIIIVTVVFAAYSVVTSSNFGVLDDYTFLLNGIVDSDETLTLLIGAGRPLNAVLLDLGFRAAGSVENLAILRAITLVGIWLLGCGLYFFSKAHSISFISSLAIACGIILLPSFQVYASWAQHFTTPFAGAIALLSAFILTPICKIRERSRILAIFLSTLLLLTSTLIYQPIAMLFFIGILISVMSMLNINFLWEKNRVIDAAISFVITMLLSLLIFKIGQYIHPSGSSRYSLVQNFYEKLNWFFSEPLANAISLYSVPSSTTIQITVIMVILLGLLSLKRKYNLSTTLLIYAYVFICVLGSYTPNLATNENWASYRSIGALSAAVVVLLTLTASRLFDMVNKKYTINIFIKEKKYLLMALIVPLIILITQAQSNVLNGFIFPNITELNNLASLLNNKKNLQTEKVTVIIRPSSWTDSSAKPMAYDEFGMPSSIIDYYAKTIVDIVLRSTNLIPNSTLIVSKSDINITDSNTIVIDFPNLVTSQRFGTIPSLLLN